jgi:hypothetical protein
MLLEQINRRLEAFKRKLQTEKVRSMVDSVSKGATKVVIIGISTPIALHERMKEFLDRVKKTPGAPKTLKQLALLAVSVGMHHLETTGIPEGDFVDADDVVAQLTGLFDPGWDVDVHRTSEGWNIVVPHNATLAANLKVPEEVNGIPVRVVRR